MRLIDYYSEKNYLTVNILIAKKIGLNESIIFGFLASKMSYYSNEKKLTDGFFYCSNDDIEERTTLTYRQQKPCIDNLIQLGVLQHKRQGNPCRSFYSILESEIKKLESVLSESIDSTKCQNKILQNVESSIDKMSEHNYIDISNKDIYISPIFINSELNTQNEKIKNSETVKNTPIPKKQQISNNINSVRQFYNFELERAKIHQNTPEYADYTTFVNILFGENDLQMSLQGVLSIPNQVTFDQYQKLNVFKIQNKKSISAILLKIENDKKYYKGKTSLYLTLSNWIKMNFNTK